MANKWVYLFSEGNANMRELLGGKGANLAEMTSMGLPVPQGFTITTEACTQYYEDGRKINDEIMGQINEYIVKMEEITGKKFGDEKNPLLVSVRSGARASMPGMMDTILNLGLNETVVNTIAEMSGNPRWAWDCYRRFIQMYSDVVMEVGKKYFEELIDEMKEKKGVTQDVELDADDLKELANQFKAEYKEKFGADFPDDPKEQPVTPLPAKRSSWVSSLQTLRARTLLQAFVLPCPSLRWLTSSPRLSHSSRTFARPSKTTTETCRIWSSPLSTASSTCCRPETAREPLRLLSRSPATSLTKA